MNTPIYLYSVTRKDTAPSEMAHWMSATFCTTCGTPAATIRRCKLSEAAWRLGLIDHLIIATLLLFKQVFAAV
jgi:hypothetical protein